jgi:hypothetical protein
VELKAIDPPPSIQDSMEKQMRADREKRATILTAEGQRESAIKTAEGQKQAQILSAEGSKQAAILNAEAERQSRILRAQGERAARYLQSQGQAKAIEKVFAAIKAGRPTPELLAYQYLQTLPQMAQGDANKVWIVPSDFGKALEGFTKMLGAPGEDGVFRYEPSADYVPSSRPEEDDEAVAGWFDTSTDPAVAAAVRAAEEVARKEVPGPAAGLSPSIGAGVPQQHGFAGAPARGGQPAGPPPPAPAEITAPQPAVPPSPPEQHSGAAAEARPPAEAEPPEQDPAPEQPAGSAGGEGPKQPPHQPPPKPPRDQG